MSQINEWIKAFTASGAINPYLRVTLSTSLLTVSTSGPNDSDVGITEGNSLVANDLISVRLATASGSRKVQVASICNPNDILYATTGGQVDTLGANGIGTAGGAIGKALFRALEQCFTAGGVIEVLPLVAGSSGATGLLFAATADSPTAGTSSASEVFFSQNIYTIPANTLKLGDVLKIKARFIKSAVNSTNTQAFKVYIGTVALSAFAAVAAPTAADEAYQDLYAVVTALGASGKIQGAGTVTDGTPGTATTKSVSLSSTTLDTTSAAVVRASVTMSVSNAGNAAILRDFTIELVRQ